MVIAEQNGTHYHCFMRDTNSRHPMRRRSSTEAWRLLFPSSFEWSRAKAGYDLVRVPNAKGADAFLIRMRDRKAGWVSYADLSDSAHLANRRDMEFIDLRRVHREAAAVEYRTHALAVQSVLPFLNRYGLPFDRIQRECRLVDVMRLCRDTRTTLQWADEPRLGEEEVAEARWHGHRYSEAEVRAIVAERVSAEFQTSGTLRPVSTPQGLTLRFEPAALADFISMRVAQEIRQDLVHKECLNCQTIFTVRNDKRELRRYACSERCKKALLRRGANPS